MIITILPNSLNFHAVAYNEKKVEQGMAELIEVRNFPMLSPNEYSAENFQEYRVSCISPWMPTTCLTKNPAQAEHEEGYVCNAPQLRPESFHLRIDGFC